MNCEQCEQLIREAVIEGASLSLEANDHLAICAPCTQRLAEVSALDNDLARLRDSLNAVQVPFVFTPDRSDRLPNSRRRLVYRVLPPLAAAAVLAMAVLLAKRAPVEPPAINTLPSAQANAAAARLARRYTSARLWSPAVPPARFRGVSGSAPPNVVTGFSIGRRPTTPRPRTPNMILMHRRFKHADPNPDPQDSRGDADVGPDGRRGAAAALRPSRA